MLENGGEAASVSVVSGPPILGASAPKMPTKRSYTFDCWKQIVHDESKEPSKGRLLCEIISSPLVTNVACCCCSESNQLKMLIQNVWGEKFLVKFFYIDSHASQLFAHATKL